jgi:hypothetical protein
VEKLKRPKARRRQSFARPTLKPRTSQIKSYELLLGSLLQILVRTFEMSFRSESYGTGSAILSIRVVVVNILLSVANCRRRLGGFQCRWGNITLREWIYRQKKSCLPWPLTQSFSSLYVMSVLEYWLLVCGHEWIVCNSVLGNTVFMKASVIAPL